MISAMDDASALRAIGGYGGVPTAGFIAAPAPSIPFKDALAIDDVVEVTQDFTASYQPQLELPRGMTGNIKRMDQNGDDILIQFQAGRQWIDAAELKNLRKLAEDAPRIGDLAFRYASHDPSHGQPLPERRLTADEDLGVARYLAETRRLPSPCSEEAVVPFLNSYGYVPQSASKWADDHPTATYREIYWGLRQPLVSFSVPGHNELGGHTQYTIKCTLSESLGDASVGKQLVSWGTIRRLSHIREGVHDTTKQVMGRRHDSYFGDAPFALPSAPAGTTSRLNGWFNALAVAINRGIIPPFQVASVFRFLDGPGTQCHPLADQLPLTSSIFGGGGVLDNAELHVMLNSLTQWSADLQELRKRPAPKSALVNLLMQIP
jgi:hypothetical protein